MKTKPNAILALDPGLRDLGFAVLAGRRLVTSGVRPLRLLPRAKRMREARRVIRGWIRAHRPGVIVFEQTRQHPVPSLNALHELTNDVRRFGKTEGIAVAAYAPQTVRKALVGNGWATKVELARAIAVRFPALRVYLTQDRRWKERYFLNLFDAVALALHHQNQIR